MNPVQPTFIIVGASLAGAKAAEELRAQGFDGRVVLIGEEAEPPYERPPLSKDYLRGDSGRDKTWVHDAGFYEQQEIELVTGVVVREIDPARKVVHLSHGGFRAYDRVLIATGAEPRRLQIRGAELDGIHYLRTLADADALRDRLRTGGKVVVVGAGWIGAEFAACARQCGLEVTMIEPQPVPLARVLGAELGGFYGRLHRENGVELLSHTGVESFQGHGSVTAVRTSDGGLIDCDFVVVGVGVSPRTGLAAAAGAEVDNGVVVNERMQTAVPDLFAAGDVASAWHPFYGDRVRVEHWANALNQGPAAARSMLDHQVAYDRIPYFFSDQYDVGMEYSGLAPAWDEVVIRGDLEAREFIAFWIKQGRVLAGMNVNVWDVSEQVQALVRSRAPLDTAALADPDTPLEALSREPIPQTQP